MQTYMCLLRGVLIGITIVNMHAQHMQCSQNALWLLCMRILGCYACVFLGNELFRTEALPKSKVELIYVQSFKRKKTITNQKQKEI